MIFDTKHVSGGLYGALYAIGIEAQKVKTFNLNINEGPVVNYLSTLNIEFTKTFHIGCSFDNRAPSFNYNAEKKDGKDRLWLVYERSLISLNDDIFPKDIHGERDLEKIVAMFSDNKHYVETITLGREINNNGMCYNPRLELNFSENKLYKLGSSSNFKEVSKQEYKGVWKKLRYSLFYRLTKKYEWENLKEDIREIKKAGVEASELTIEFLKIFEKKSGDITILTNI
jgi:hypothetical protein